ncbi:efflux RND transporter periplasmic adaptor subunit, partial [bacterium]|nr:efflux RND transporter periplasmic adaptor subunit [bacterium]
PTVSPELARNRTGAVITTLMVVGGVVAGLGVVPAPEHMRLEGLVELERHQAIYADTDGFIRAVIPSDYGYEVTPNGPALAEAVSPELQAARKELLAAKSELLSRKAVALDAGSTVSVQAYDKQLAVSKRRLADVDRRIAALDRHAPFAGQWISPNIEKALGAYVRQGDQIGVVAGKAVRIRATASQEVVALLWERYEQGVIGPGDIEIRLKDLPDLQITGMITQRIEAGKDRLSSPALGYAAGGSIRTDAKDPKGTKAAEKFFELLVKPDPVGDPDEKHWHGKVPLLSGQRVTLRVSLPARPLAMQWYRSILQFVEGRFKR